MERPDGSRILEGLTAAVKFLGGRNRERDGGSLCQDGGDGEAAAEFSGPRLHVLQTHALRLRSRRRKSAPVIGDLQTDLVAVSLQPHHPLVGLRMANAVARRF